MSIPAYASLDDLRDKNHTPPEWSYVMPYDPKDDPVLTNMLLRSSRIFDMVAQRAPGYFKATDGSSTQAVVAGDGTNYLRLPVYVAGSLTQVTVPSGYQVPNYSEVTDELGQQWLIRSDASGLRAPYYPYDYYEGPVSAPLGLGKGFPQGLPITITAKWGFAATPEDVKEVVLELTTILYRSKDALAQRILDLDKSPQLKAGVPDRVKEVANRYAQKRAIVLA